MKILLAAAAVFGLSKILNLGQTALTADSLEVKPSAFKFVSASWNSFTFQLSLKILNPTRNNLKINFVFADVSVSDGTVLTSIRLPDYNKTVMKENETGVKIPIKITSADALLNVAPLWKKIKNGSIPDTLNVKGYIKANNITVPFNENIKVFND
jgi:hypothetical protein